MNLKGPVFYFARMLPAYRLPVMERLNKRLNGQFIVFHGQPPQGNPVLMNEQKGTFQRVFRKNYWYNDTKVHAQPFNGVFKEYGAPAVVLAEESPRSITLPFLLRKAKRLGAGRVLWGIFYSVHRPFSGDHPLQRYRIRMAQRVEACACYARQSKTYMSPFVDERKLFVAQNTMDMDTLSTLRRSLEAEGKKAVRRRLGLDEDRPTFVFVAQLVKRKGTEELINIFHEIRSKQPATLLVIGGGPEHANMEQQVQELGVEDVHLLGPISELEKSAPYLFAADLMLLPGYVGLVVNHAFSMGLPVLTYEAPENLPFHGPEVESIVNGENGMIVERGNQPMMIDTIHQVLDNRDTFSQNAASYAEKNLSLDHMVDGLMGAIHYAAESVES